MNNEELLILKAELENDPANIGLTTLVEDDTANADKLNEVRDTVRVYRASVPSDSINIPIDEYAAASQAQRDWYAMQTADGSVAPAVIEAEFYKMFAAGTGARASFDEQAKESASRGRQLFGRFVWITPSDVANARNLVV